MTRPETHPETVTRLQRYAARQPEPASQEDVEAAMPRTITHNHTYGPDCAEMDREREAGRSAEAGSSPPVAADGAHVSMPALSRYENNLSDARMLAEDASDLVRRFTQADTDAEWVQIAQAKALASIALSMAFKGGAS